MIPRTLHFIWVALPDPPTEEHLLGIKTALLNTTCKLILHTNDISIQLPGVETRLLTIPATINGVEFQNDTLKTQTNNRVKDAVSAGKRISHLKDILRLDILYQEGGIYSDLDVLWLRNPVEYFDKKVVIGWSNESYKILINCVMMASPHQQAILEYKNWLVSIYPCKKYWIPANPYKLWKDNPDITFAKKHKFCPVAWNKTKDITWDKVEKSICVHLFASGDSQPSGEVVRAAQGGKN